MDRREYLAVLATGPIAGCTRGLVPRDAAPPRTRTTTATPAGTPTSGPTTTGTATRTPTATETEDPANAENDRRLGELQAVVGEMHADFLADVGGDELTDVTAATGGPAVTRLNELRDVAGDILQTIDPRNARQRRVEAALEFAVTFYAEGAVCQRELGSAFRDLRGPINGLNAWEPFELRNRAGLAGTHAYRAEARWSAISTAGGRDRFRFVDAIDPDDYTAKMDQWDLAIDNVGDLVTFVDDFTEGNATLEDARSTYDEGNYQEAEDLAGQAAGAFAALQDAVDATSFTDGFVELADAFDRRLPAYRREAEELRTDAIVAQV